MANLKIGSAGKDVKTLQTALGFTGEDVDGIYGPKTEAAVIQYQKDNDLYVDGIAGEQTLGKLYGTNTGATIPETNPTTAPTIPALGKYSPTDAPNRGEFSYEEFSYPNFALSDNYQTAMDLVSQNSTTKPGEYVPVWEDKADGWLDKYQNRDPFSYDFNSDALYQQYADQYIQQGRLAMEDTMGQAAALTGGYGNSYAQQVGQQVYNQYLGKLNEVGLELYDRAYNRYNQEGQDMLAMYDLYMDRETQARANHQTDVENWYREDARLRDNADTIYTREWNEWDAGRNNAWKKYVMGRSEAREDFALEEQQKLDLYLLNREEKSTAKANAKSDLITLITGTGYNPSDEELADAGMTRKQVNGYKDAYNQSVAKTSQKTTEYTVLDYDEQAKWNKAFENAMVSENPVEQINNIGARMISANVDPTYVAQTFILPFAKRLISEGKANPEDFGVTLEDLGLSG